jgi:hypothetical protein
MERLYCVPKLLDNVKQCRCQLPIGGNVYTCTNKMSSMLNIRQYWHEKLQLSAWGARRRHTETVHSVSAARTSSSRASLHKIVHNDMQARKQCDFKYEVARL